MQPVTILVVVCCLGIANARDCRGDREDREHECHNDGEVCMDGRCRDPCNEGYEDHWRIVVDDPQQHCHDHRECYERHCHDKCDNGQEQSGRCDECRHKIQCRRDFCCKPRDYW